MPSLRPVSLAPRVLSLLAGVALASSPARAQDAFPLAADPALMTLVTEAIAKNPELRAARERILAAEARIPQASALPDPVVTLGYDKSSGFKPGADSDTGPKLAVLQELPYSGKRRLAGEVEAREAELVRHAARRTQVALVYQVRRAYADLLLARENLLLIEDQRRATKDIEELTRSRYVVGLAGQADVLRAQAELARLDQMRFHEEGLVTSALAELNRLLARPAGTPVDESARLTSLSGRPIDVPPLLELLARAEAMSPAVNAGGAMVERSRVAIELARRRLKPDFLVSSEYLNRGSLPDIWTVDVGVVLPFYSGRKQKQAIAEAESRLRSDRAEQEAMSLRVRAAVERAHADFKAAVLESQAYENGVLAVDALAVESALASFQAGKAPFLSVLEAHNTLYRDRWQHAELLFHVLWHSALLDAFGMGE